MDFFDMPFGNSSNSRRSGRRPNSRNIGSRRRDNSYRVEEIDDLGDTDNNNNNGATVNRGEYTNNTSSIPDRESMGGSTPRVYEPENEFGSFGSMMGNQYPSRKRSEMSSALMLDPFGDDSDDDFFGGFGGGFGSMFGDMRRHMDRMRQTFSSAFNEIETMSAAGDGTSGSPSSRIYCSSTCETILPNGVREVRHTSRDSATGKQTSYHSRQIGDKQVVERSRKDLRSGVEQRERNMLNVDDNEAEEFERRWRDFGLSSGNSQTKSLK